MKLVQFHCDGDEYFINPDKIMYIHKSKHKPKDEWTDGVRINLVDDMAIMVDESLREVISRIGNQELNVAYDCLAEIEKLKKSVKNLGRITAPAEL